MSAPSPFEQSLLTTFRLELHGSPPLAFDSDRLDAILGRFDDPGKPGHVVGTTNAFAEFVLLSSRKTTELLVLVIELCGFLLTRGYVREADQIATRIWGAVFDQSAPAAAANRLRAITALSLREVDWADERLHEAARVDGQEHFQRFPPSHKFCMAGIEAMRGNVSAASELLADANQSATALGFRPELTLGDLLSRLAPLPIWKR